MIRIVVNGETREVPENLTVSALLDFLGLAAQPLLVEQNGLALFKTEWPEKTVQPHDRFELIRIVAGG